MQKDANKRSVKVNAVLNVTKTVVSLIFPLITFPYSSHVLGVEAIGRYNFSSSIVSYFALLAALGIAMYAVREGSKYRDDPKKISHFCSEIFSINVYSAVISLILLGLCVWFVPKLQGYAILILILSLRIILTTINVNWIYNIFEDFLLNTIVTIIMDIASIAAMLLLVHSPSDLYIYVFITVMAYSGYGIFTFAYVHHYVKLKFIWNPRLYHLKPIFIIFSMELGATIYISSDITILGWLAGDHATGLYSTASNIYMIVKQMLNALILVVIPRFSYLIGAGELAQQDGNHDKAVECHKEAVTLGETLIDSMITFCLPSMIGLIIMAEPIVLVFAGSSFIDSVTSLQLLSVALIFAMMENFYGDCILIAYKRELTYMCFTIIAALINIILNFILIPTYAQNAAAVTTIIAEVFMGLATMIVSQKNIKVMFHWQTLIKTIIGCGAIAGICWAIRLFVNGTVPYLAAGVAASIVVYALVEIALKNTIVIDIADNILKRIRRK